MVFKLERTWSDPAAYGDAQGFPTPGTGAQKVRPAQPTTPGATHWWSTRPTKGRRTFSDVLARGMFRGFAPPESAAQSRPPGSMPARQVPFGTPINKPVFPYSTGAPGVVQTYGKVLTNPIGAGIVALNRPQASYGPAGQYFPGIGIFWTSQVIPTTIAPQSLTSPRVLEAILGRLRVYGAVRTG